MKTPWEQLMINVNMCQNRQTQGMQKKPCNKKRVVDIDEHYLKALFEQQNGRCYWTNYPIDPKDILVPWSPLAMSVDRLDNQLDYTKGNVVICTRQENLGRSGASVNQWIDVKRKMNEHYKQMALNDIDLFEEQQKKHEKLSESLCTTTFYDIFK